MVGKGFEPWQPWKVVGNGLAPYAPRTKLECRIVYHLAFALHQFMAQANVKRSAR